MKNRKVLYPENCRQCGRKLPEVEIKSICWYCQHIEQLPKKYRDLKDKHNFRLEIKKHLNDSLLLYGETGAGKTVFSTFMCRQNWINNRLAKWINFPDWLSETKKYINKSDENTDSLKRYPGLLVIDDLGAGSISNFYIERSYLIIDYRQTNNLQTVITTNLTIDELSEELDPRIARRIRNMCKQMKFEGDKSE